MKKGRTECFQIAEQMVTQHGVVSPPISFNPVSVRGEGAEP